jgi:hypothetical protein
MISKLYLNQRSKLLFLRGTSRCFSSAQYEAFDENIFYSPVRPVTFSNGASTIFHQATKAAYVPYEIKEATIKNFMGVAGMVIVDYLFAPGAAYYTAGTLVFGANWVYSVYRYLGNAITRIELQADGKTVQVTFKTGGVQLLKIKDIVKK